MNLCKLAYKTFIEINLCILLKNPFRYRSYYFDQETGLYYLNSRYYAPQIGRFINVDDIGVLNDTKGILNGLNLFVYCNNNPIMNTDRNGASWLSDLFYDIKNFILGIGQIILGTIGSIGMVIGGLALTIGSGGLLGGVGSALIGAGIGGFIGGIQSSINGGSFINGYIGGVISGAITGFSIVWGPVGVLVGAFVGNIIGTILTDLGNGENMNNQYYWCDLLDESLIVALVSGVAWKWGSMISVIKNVLKGIYASITVLSEFVFNAISDFCKSHILNFRF